MKRGSFRSLPLLHKGQLPEVRNFGLILAITTRCNLRCSYCYAGRKTPSSMAAALANHAIDRAMNSLAPSGRLELSFFGGEPLLEAELLQQLARYARNRAGQAGCALMLQLTTNGTVTTEEAWNVMLSDDIQVAVSCDGQSAAHNRHRRSAEGEATWQLSWDTLRRLVDAGRDPCVITVVRPDTLALLPEGISQLARIGVRFIQPSLDLWTTWSSDDLTSLAQALSICADLWRTARGTFGIGWFDEMAARLAGVPMDPCARCAFGAGQIAVSPSGSLYPCERLIGDDEPDNPHRLAGHAMDGEHFLNVTPSPHRAHEACEQCTIRDICNTTCRCSNYVRTGDIRRPDRLLCQLNQICFQELSRVLLADEPPTSDPEGLAAQRGKDRSHGCQ